MKPKGVQGLIQQHNPNRMGGKANRKVTDLPEGGVKVELSRRERSEIVLNEAIIFLLSYFLFSSYINLDHLRVRFLTVYQ